jgi:aminoglycoside phosphotransferase
MNSAERDARKPKLQREQLPAELTAAIAGYTWQRITGGWSTAEVVRLESPHRPTLFLKAEARGGEGELRAERARLEWIGERLPVPRVRLFAADAACDYLLTREIPGIDASDALHGRDIERLVALLADGMRRIHRLPIAACPFDHGLEARIAAARERMRRGLVDEEDFDAICQGRTAEDLFQEILRTRPAGEDLVFTHGDYCLPNILLDGGQLSGFIDWGRAGVADRYQDLALAARSLAHNFGAAGVPQLFEAYGIPLPNSDKIAFYQLLDEFF